MIKDIKEYLKYYIGQKHRFRYIDWTEGYWSRWFSLTPWALSQLEDPGIERIELALRRLEDITEDEILAGGWSRRSAFEYYLQANNGAFHPGDFHYLLSKGFDLFNMIDQGAALELKKINNG